MIESNKGLDVVLNSLVPPVMRKSLTPNAPDHVRARSLAVMLFGSSLMLVLGALVIIADHLLANPDLLLNDIASIILASLFGIQAILFWRFGNLWLSGAIFITTYFMLLAGLVLVSGGIESPMKTTLLTYPVAAYLIGGRAEGLQSALITFLFVIGLAGLSAIDFTLPNLIIADNAKLIFTLNWLFSLVIISFCITVYENELEVRFAQQEFSPPQNEERMSNLNKPFDNFVHSLVPEQLRDKAGLKTQAGTRALKLAMMLMMASASSFVSAVILIGIHLVFYIEQLKYDWIIVGITLCFLLQTWMFYKFKNIVLSGYLISYFYFLVILVLVMLTGGYDAPDMILLLLSPIIFFMLGGIMKGIQNATFTAVAVLTFAFLEHMDIQFVNVFHAVSSTMIFSISWCIAILAIAVCMITYDEALQNRIE